MRWMQAATVIDDPVGPYRSVERRGRKVHGTDGRDPGCWVLANMVSGLDGSVAVGGRVGALSSPTDAELFRTLRSVADVVLVGAETVRREKYGPVRLPDGLRAERAAAGRAAVPRLAIVSRSLQLDWDAPVFTEADPASATIVVTCAAAPRAQLDEAGRHAVVLLAGDERVEPRAALAALAGLGSEVVLCEGGPTLLGELVAADLLDELCLTIEPVMGGDPLPVAITPASAALVRHRIAHVLVDGDTIFLRYEREDR
jgi:riboflavin biosynthesis pyrimidine reductase